ncbi:YeeE/YedE family protein [Pedobacter glucosidilyticus]|uniref:YeeE/YedE family protein n=1 Tax=Pedobacter glucosidilyticus TaxID=1122941 RepID=UPI0026EE365C|nr:YeeE/YedE thiosulfate transporter family protein [Pedobacter glucosidilyticus]
MMLEILKQPWPWYVSGVAIAFIMILLLFFGKSFGFSSNLRTMCSMAGAGKKVKFFDFDWKSQQWNLLFLVGSVIGGIIASTILKNDEPLALSASTIQDLKQLGIAFDGQLNPSHIFGLEFATSFKGILILLIGGFLVGFGSRYAGGCTSGHAISGLSNLQIPSLVAVIGFFIGGLAMTYFILPLIF